MILKDYSGGMHLRMHPSLIPTNKGVIYTNIQNDKVSLIPDKKDKKLPNAPEYLYWYWFRKADYLVSRPYRGTFIEFRNWCYYFKEGGGGNLKYKDTDVENPQPIGVNPPTEALELDNVENTTDTTYKGNVVYTYTFYNPDTGIESVPAPKLEAGEYSDYVILTVKNFQQPPDGFKIRLYRIDDMMIDFNLVAEFDYQATYRDDNASEDVAGDHILDSYHNYPPPDGLKYVIEAHTIFIGAVENKLYYSQPAEPEYWPKENFIEFDTDITGIAYLQTGILVHTRYRTYIITGTSSTTFTRYLLNGNIGCENFYSIQYVNNGVIWHSNKGIVWSSGGKIELVSYPELGEIDFKSFNSAAVNRLYLLHTSLGVLIFDFRLGVLNIKRLTELGE